MVCSTNHINHVSNSIVKKSIEQLKFPYIPLNELHAARK